MQDYRKMAVWQRSHLLTLRIYAVSRGYPRDEEFGVAGQMRRAAASIPSNLVEGRGRGTDAELARFVSIALGSANELEYQVGLSRDLGYIKEQEYLELTNEVAAIKRMMFAFLKRLRPKSSRPSTVSRRP